MRVPGKSAKAGRVLTMSSKNLLGRPVMAEVRALPSETSPEIRGAPSMRAKPSRMPLSSSTEIATAQLFLPASASQAAMIFFTSADVNAFLVRINAPGLAAIYSGFASRRWLTSLQREADRYGEIELVFGHGGGKGRQRLGALDHRHDLVVKRRIARAARHAMLQHVAGAVDAEA